MWTNQNMKRIVKPGNPLDTVPKLVNITISWKIIAERLVDFVVSWASVNNGLQNFKGLSR